MAFTEGEFTNPRNQKLVTVQYLPQSEPAAVVLFHHGLGEHVGRYKPVFTQMATMGLAVYSYDAHGHGRSEPADPKLRAYIHNFTDLLDDFEHYLAQVREKHVGKPVFAAGHSLGGLVAAHAVASKPTQYAGAVLHSPALDVEWTPILRIQASVGSLLALLFPRAPLVPAVRPEDMSSDPQVVKEYLEDPLIVHGNVKTRTANETLKAFRKLPQVLRQADLPLYVCHGGKDRCTSARASRRVHDTWPHQDKSYHLLDEGYHELLHGPEREDCVKRMGAWILERSKPRAAL